MIQNIPLKRKALIKKKIILVYCVGK